MENHMANISDLVGDTIFSIELINDDEISIRTKRGLYKMQHLQDCCENVYVDDIVGDPADLVGGIVIAAEEVSSDESPPDEVYFDASYTWTFYKIDTNKGGITIRCFGS